MNEDKRKGLAREALSRYITEHHRRCTPERFAVLDKVLDMPSRFTIDELTTAIEGGDFRVSKATVYNSIDLFARAGIVKKLHLSADTWEVALDNPPIVRLVCEQCGKVREVKDSQLFRALSFRRYTSFTAKRFEVCVSGLCTRCQNNGKRKGIKKIQNK